MSTTLSSLPAAARLRLVIISVGWILVAALEATAYTILALAIANAYSPGVVLLSACVAIIATVMVTRAGFFSGARLAGDLYAALGLALARTKLSWFTNKHRAQIAMIAGRGIPGFMSIPAHQLQTFLHAPLIPLFLLLAVGLLAGIHAVLITAALLLLSLVIQFLAQRALSRADGKRHEADHGAVQATVELVDHIELLRTTAGPARAIERLEHSWQKQEAALHKTNNAAAGAVFTSILSSALPLLGMAFYLLWAGIHDANLALALLMIVARASAPLGELALAGLSINDLRASLNDYHHTTSAPSLPEPSQQREQACTPHLRVQHLSHGPVLRDLSVDIPVGATVVVNGPSGSGKSTLLELLMRFDDPQHGSIQLGDIALTQLPYQDVAAQFAYVSQDPIVFSGTLADNIRLARPTATDADIEAIARQALLGHVIDRSPLGIHTDVGHQGSALSGGERQRVAMARALLKNAPILILDEATSALDEHTERELVEMIRTLPITVIVVTHRDPNIWQPSQTINLGEDLKP